MKNFTFKIECKDNQYFFALYPNNIPNQEIGYSPLYENITLCQEALEQFRYFVKENRIWDYTSSFVRIEKRENLYYFKYYNRDVLLFFRIRGYTTKQNCKNGITSIWRNIDAKLV